MRTFLSECRGRACPRLCILSAHFLRIYQTVLLCRCNELQRFLFYICYSFCFLSSHLAIIFLLTHASAVPCAPLRHTQHITTLFTSPDNYGAPYIPPITGPWCLSFSFRSTITGCVVQSSASSSSSIILLKAPIRNAVSVPR